MTATRPADLLVVVVDAEDGPLLDALEGSDVQTVIDTRSTAGDALTRAIRAAGWGYRRAPTDTGALVELAAGGRCAVLCPDLRSAEHLAAMLLGAGLSVGRLHPDGVVSPFQLPLGW